MRYLLDTDTCISVMRGQPIVLNHLANTSPADCYVSTITGYELGVGVEKSANPANERPKLDLFLHTFRSLPFDQRAAEEAARIRAFLETQGTPIGPYDTLLAGQARSMALIMVTANVREFARVPSLIIENWHI